VTRSLLDELREAIDAKSHNAYYACGGSIPIVQPGGSANEGDDNVQDGISYATTCPPIALRWDPVDKTTLAVDTKLIFPLEESTKANVDQLVQDTIPASFGRDGDEVYDETYRKASKLDPFAFASTVNPYDLGIVDAITQVLLPSVPGSKNLRGVRAEASAPGALCQTKTDLS
jgi:hypothetical protein